MTHFLWIQILFFTISTNVIANASGPCLSAPDDGQTLDNHIHNVSQVVSGIFKKHKLVDVKVSYGAGPFSKDIGIAEVSLGVIDGQISDLRFNTVGSIFGVDVSSKRKIKIDQLIAGHEIGYEATEGGRELFRARGGASFNAENGGPVEIEFWTGEKYEQLSLEVQKRGRKFIAFRRMQNNSLERVRTLQMQAGGFSSDGLHVASYEFD